jgi:hypothetical protein
MISFDDAANASAAEQPAAAFLQSLGIRPDMGGRYGHGGL